MRFLAAIALVSMLYASAVPSEAAAAPKLSVGLEWNSNPEPDIAGYRVYFGLTPGRYVRSVDVGNTNRADIELPLPGREYFFAVTAYDTEALESFFSTEISYAAPDGEIPATDVEHKISVLEDTPLKLDLAIPNPGSGQPADWLLTRPPAHGKIETVGDGIFFVPNADWFGRETFEIVRGVQSLKIIRDLWTLDITPVNDPPLANEQWDIPSDGTPVPVVLLGWDPDGDSLTFQIVSQPAHGTLSGSPPNVVYTPNPDFEGTDTFSFIALDGQVASPPATVSVVVERDEQPVLARDQTEVLPEDESLDFRLDVSPNPDTRIEITQLPSSGILEGTPPNLRYKPNPDFSGTDTLVYQASNDAGQVDIAVVYLSVEPVNDPPSIELVTADAAPGIPTPIVLKASDIDGDTLVFNIVDPPALGELSGAPPNLTYRARPDATGSDQFSFSVSDGSITSPTAIVIIQIQASEIVQPVLEVAFTAGNAVSLRWQARPNLSYQVVFKESIRAADWVPASPKLESAGEPILWTGERESGSTAGFYAVRVSPR